MNMVNNILFNDLSIHKKIPHITVLSKKKTL